MIEAISSLTSSVGGPGAASASTITGRVAQPSFSSASGTDFASVFADVSNEAINSMKTGEAMAISGIQGKASVQNVVQAVLSAEQTLQTALAVRDKVVAAYQEISRMAI